MNITRKALILLLFLLLSTYTVNSQVIGKDNIVGKNYLIESTILAEQREIQIYLPDDYEENENKYPVLYILDGQRFFLHSVGLHTSFTRFKLTSKFIVVGIKNKYPQRFGHFSRGAIEFSNFIEKELITFIDDNFRTTDERWLFGWEYAGSFALKNMLEKPTLFQAYFLASPYPIEPILEKLDTTLSFEKALATSVYFSISPKEGVVKEGTDKLAEVLKNKKNNLLQVVYQILENEEHRSTPYSTLYNGLRTYFEFYPELQVDILSEFLEKGGLEYAEKYNKVRAEKYGFPIEFSDWTKFTIIRSALRAEEYQHFNTFYETFMTKDFIGGLRGSRPYVIAEFYEKNDRYDKAIDIYKILVEKNPSAIRPLNSLGNAYKSLKNEKEAERYFQKARDLSEK